MIGNKNIQRDKWFFTYPQYYPQTAIPFIETEKELLLPGQYVGSIPDTLIDKFNFIANINFNLEKVEYSHHYPPILYGANSTWGTTSTEIYIDFDSGRKKLIYSFPVSHDLYITDLNSDSYQIVYGGSNQAGTISSIDEQPEKVSRKKLMLHFVQNDEYAAIKYDKYRKLYYRILRKAIPNATEESKWKDKPVVVIIMDENFKYLGETTIGTLKEWNLSNLFVTKEGLNIEYLENDFNETYLTLKIFTLKKLE